MVYFYFYLLLMYLLTWSMFHSQTQASDHYEADEEVRNAIKDAMLG